LLRFFVLR
jgi:hypothetical protein